MGKRNGKCLLILLEEHIVFYHLSGNCLSAEKVTESSRKWGGAVKLFKLKLDEEPWPMEED